jgi:hypothetical protein
MPFVQLVFERQWLHASLLAVLLLGAALTCGLDGFRDGQLWGIDTIKWFWIAIAIAVGHQAFVWLCWRAQLHANGLTRILGNLAFPLYAIGFSVLGILRVVVVILLAIANRDTLLPESAVLKFLAVGAAIPAAYLFYSVKRYFSFKRAFGIDHFDPGYRTASFERRGIFRFTRNGMYVYGFLILWVPGLWFGSLAALCAALFNHLYIWVHYYSTELPDMERIYGEVRASTHNEVA